jgi:Protein of unknown function (DUF3309)
VVNIELRSKLFRSGRRGVIATHGELREQHPPEEVRMSLGLILLIILILLLVGALPTWPYSSGWGYYPSGGLGLVLLVVLVLLLLGRL